MMVPYMNIDLARFYYNIVTSIFIKRIVHSDVKVLLTVVFTFNVIFTNC